MNNSSFSLSKFVKKTEPMGKTEKDAISSLKKIVPSSVNVPEKNNKQYISHEPSKLPDSLQKMQKYLLQDLSILCYQMICVIMVIV